MNSSRARARSCCAGVLLTALALAPVCRADDAPADAATMAEARRHFLAGVNLLDDPDGARYEEAYHAFHKAYAVSRSPKVLGNIGLCSLKLERDGEAMDAYASYLRDSHDVEPRERDQIERDLATLASTVATFRVTAKLPPSSSGPVVVHDTRTQTRGAPVLNTYALDGRALVLRLRPGRHLLKVKRGDAESIVFETTIEPGSQMMHEFTFPQPRAATTAVPETRPSYAGPIVVGIAGLLAIGTGTVTGLLARSKTQDLESRCPGDVCPRGYDFGGDRREAKTFATIADATFLGGGVALAGALVWAILVPSAKRARTGRIEGFGGTF